MKIDTNSIIKQYDANLNKYKRLVESIHYTLSKAIATHGIKIHSIHHRIKEIGSLLKTARRKKIENPLEHLHDLVGFRIICLFRPDLEEIEKMIREEFSVFYKDDKVNDSELDFFGYMSMHLEAYVKHSPEETPTDEKLEIPFEIQVRTIAQDAWASVSHYLEYKKESVIPDKLKKDFYALSGLFYVADTHFSILRQEQSQCFLDKSSNKR